MRGTTALIVTPDSALREALLAILSRLPARVLDAKDEGEATALFLASEIDLVLVDDRIPEGAAYGLCTRLRQSRNWRPGKQIIALASDLASVVRARQSGATDFVMRPVDGPVFEERLRYQLSARGSVDEHARDKEWLRNTQRQASLANFDLNVDSGQLICSDEMDHLLGLPAGCPPRHLDEFFACIVEDDRARVWDIFETAISNRTELTVDFRISHRSGGERFLRARSCGDVTGQRLCGTLQDVTEGHRIAERISFLSFYDELTHLANRNLFKDLLAKAMAQAARNGFKLVGLFMDLDKFQRINDSLGPRIGDQLLRLVAERVKKVLRGTDWIARNSAGTANEEYDKLARLGGDEFTILLADIAKIEVGARVAQRILDCLAEAFWVEGHEIYISASIGITIFPDDSGDLDSFMKNGDAAMYHAKAQGRNNYQFFNESLHSAASGKLELEIRLRRALENHELVLHYQPKIDAETGSVLGVEALVRWNHEEMGLVPPAQFIPIAEETGLIVPIGEWVLNEACRQAKAWEKGGLDRFSIAVNLSASQFRGPDLCKRVAAILASHDMEPGRIEVELTESMLMHDVENAIRKMLELRDIGLTLSIDDFGTGYSSLSHLMRFPLNTLKIDRSFVRELATDEHCASITRAILVMAKSLKLQVVAEGVETSQQVSWLREHDCDILQGYYFSPALPADALAEFCTLLKASGHGQS